MSHGQGKPQNGQGNVREKSGNFVRAHGWTPWQRLSAAASGLLGCIQVFPADWKLHAKSSYRPQGFLLGDRGRLRPYWHGASPCCHYFVGGVLWWPAVHGSGRLCKTNNKKTIYKRFCVIVALYDIQHIRHWCSPIIPHCVRSTIFLPNNQG